ncbi:hypothetical protein Taro_028579 [Colocasia esculenta]|uniref:Uncharacterized protein n=1 Tax=Colocasia esculenta TaxID=4460 RepID=A0A843VLG3_COLES|nr:hypothetical protein [Colocasia esculenta]
MEGKLHVCQRQRDALINGHADGVCFIVDFLPFRAAGPWLGRLDEATKSVDFEETFVDKNVTSAVNASRA